MQTFPSGHDSWVMRCLKHWKKDKNGCLQLENLLRNNWQCTQANTNCCRIANRRRQQAGDGRRCGRRGKERETERRTTSNKRQQTTQLTQQFRWVCENLLFLPASPSTNPSFLLTDSFYVGKQNLFTPNPKLCSTMGILALALDNANVCRGRRRMRRRRKKKEHKRKKQLELSGKSEKIWKHFEGVQHEICAVLCS